MELSAPAAVHPIYCSVSFSSAMELQKETRISCECCCWRTFSNTHRDISSFTAIDNIKVVNSDNVRSGCNDRVKFRGTWRFKLQNCVKEELNWMKTCRFRFGIRRWNGMWGESIYQLSMHRNKSQGLLISWAMYSEHRKSKSRPVGGVGGSLSWKKVSSPWRVMVPNLVVLR